MASAVRHARMSPATASMCAAEVSAAAVGTAEVPAAAMPSVELRSAGMMSAAHGATTALRVKIGGAARADLAKSRGMVGAQVTFAGHRVVAEVVVRVQAISDLTAMFARGAVGDAITNIRAVPAAAQMVADIRVAATRYPVGPNILDR